MTQGRDLIQNTETCLVMVMFGHSLRLFDDTGHVALFGKFITENHFKKTTGHDLAAFCLQSIQQQKNSLVLVNSVDLFGDKYTCL